MKALKQMSKLLYEIETAPSDSTTQIKRESFKHAMHWIERIIEDGRMEERANSPCPCGCDAPMQNVIVLHPSAQSYTAESP